MNEKITLPALINLFALRTGASREESEKFVKEFFSTIVSSLEKGEQVKVPELGVFKGIMIEARRSVNVSTGEEYEIPAHKRIVLTPAKEVAADINEPFEMFTSVEVEDNDEDDEVISQSDESRSEEAEDEVVSQSDVLRSGKTVEIVTAADESPVDISADEEVEEVIEAEVEIEPEEVAEAEEVVEPEEVAEETEEEVAEAEELAVAESVAEPVICTVSERPRRYRFLGGFAVGFTVAVLLMVITALCAIKFYDNRLLISTGNQQAQNVTAVSTKVEAKESKVVDVNAQEVAISEAEKETITTTDKSETTKDGKTASAEVKPTDVPDGAKDVPTSPSDKKIYDTISKTRYLTTMSKDHYGNYHFWPYIYMENQKFLGHPDRIRPGTQVVIPDLKKYGVNPKSEADILKAKRLGQEIYSRYK